MKFYLALIEFVRTMDIPGYQSDPTYPHVRSGDHWHSLELVHGDLTMKNCLVAESGVVRVADWGAAHSAHGFLLGPGQEFTTVRYCSENVGEILMMR